MNLVVHGCARAPEDRLRLGPVRLDAVGRTLRELSRERERLVHELHRLEQAVGDTELRDLRTGEHPVLSQRVRDDHLDGGLGPHEPREQLRSTPRREEAEEHLRQREVPDRGRHRARGAVKRELDAAAETGAVDRGNGRKRQRAEPAEELVACAASFARTLGCDARELRDVRAGGEEERLAGDHGCGEVALLELRQRSVEGLHRGFAEERRLGVVLAVVDRDERDVAGARDAELSYWSQGSPTATRHPFPSRRRAQAARTARWAARESHTQAARAAARLSPRVDGRTRSRRRTD